MRELIDLLYGWLLVYSAEPGFWPGVFVGAVGLAIVALVVFRIRDWWGGVMAPFGPQSVAHTTDRTPAQVVLSSCLALFAGLVIAACVLAFLIWIVFGVPPVLWTEC